MQEIHIYLKLFVGEKKTLFKALFAGDEWEGEGHARKGSQGEGCQEKHLLGEGQTNTKNKYKKQIQKTNTNTNTIDDINGNTI